MNALFFPTARCITNAFRRVCSGSRSDVTRHSRYSER